MTLVSIRTPSKHKVATWSALADRSPAHAVVADIDLRLADLTTYHREMAHLSGVAYGGVAP
ncbi:hypothetical protein [Nannocystis sp.]|uniref:hypothetical protein n=1 Tax=Nannocystis sp. TaxID=1962667 RepID=UPI002429F0F1|nr:hypothetical protein [Nannocystis sp.]MBK7829293.1 hypothetical protein [Nannocystis sp.]MBK9752690.1 hypothetical protein [Nannocystis sp.]